jgi:hypothetical protein
MSKTTNLQKLECLEVYRRTLKTPRKPKFNNPSAEVFNTKLKRKYFKELGGLNVPKVSEDDE